MEFGHASPVTQCPTNVATDIAVSGFGVQSTNSSEIPDFDDDGASLDIYERQRNSGVQVSSVCTCTLEVIEDKDEKDRGMSPPRLGT